MADVNDGGDAGAPAVSADRRASGRWIRENSDNGTRPSNRYNGRWRGGRGGARVHRGQHGPRPNFFVGFRITTESIITQIEQLQQSIALTFPDLEMCLIDPRTLHVTLCVLRLSDDEAIQEATQILHTVTPVLASQCFGDASPTFTFTGWRFFGANDILFTPLAVGTAHGQAYETNCLLVQFAELLHVRFRDAGFTTEAFRKPFTPHLTIWKTTKNRKHINQLNASREPAAYVQHELFAFLTDNHSCDEEHGLAFGSESPASIELLSMMEKEDDGASYMISVTCQSQGYLKSNPCGGFACSGYYRAHASATFMLEAHSERT